jgi:hypothetical protein
MLVGLAHRAHRVVVIVLNRKHGVLRPGQNLGRWCWASLAGARAPHRQRQHTTNKAEPVFPQQQAANGHIAEHIGRCNCSASTYRDKGDNTAVQCGPQGWDSAEAARHSRWFPRPQTFRTTLALKPVIS